jgi:hypothetical protein
MVLYNHGEERIARIEHMVERLQREQTALTLLTEKLSRAVTKRSLVVTYAAAPKRRKP